MVEAEVYAIAPLRPRALSVELREIWPAAFSPPRLPLARCQSKNLARDQKKALAPIFSERALLDSLQRWALEDLEESRRTLTATDAHGDHAPLRLAALSLKEKVADASSPRHAEGVAHGN